MRPAGRREGHLVRDQECIDGEHLIEVAEPGEIAGLDAGDPCRQEVPPTDELADVIMRACLRSPRCMPLHSRAASASSRPITATSAARCARGQEFTRPLGYMAMRALRAHRRRVRRARDRALAALPRRAAAAPRPRPDDPLRQTRRRAPGGTLDQRRVAATVDVASALLESGLDRLECSMDANGRDGYRAMRGRDHFARVERNVRALPARKSAHAAREKPVTSIQFMRTRRGRGELAAIVEAWRAESRSARLRHDDPTGALRRRDRRRRRRAAPRPRPPCAWLFSSLVITQDGTVLMCGADWDARAPLGHLDDAKLGEIWRGAEAERRRRAHREGASPMRAPAAPARTGGSPTAAATPTRSKRSRNDAASRRPAARDEPAHAAGHGRSGIHRLALRHAPSRALPGRSRAGARRADLRRQPRQSPEGRRPRGPPRIRPRLRAQPGAGRCARSSARTSSCTSPPRRTSRAASSTRWSFSKPTCSAPRRC